MKVVNLNEYKRNKSEKGDNDFNNRVSKVRDSLNKINSLMDDLRKQSEKENREKNNIAVLKTNRLSSDHCKSNHSEKVEKRCNEIKKQFKRSNDRVNISKSNYYKNMWRYAKTKNKWTKNQNCFFDANKCRAYSYNWWRFVDCISGIVVFNDYSYSSSTTKHQSHIQTLLRYLNIKVDYYIHAPCGLDDLPKAIDYYQEKIDDLNDLINKPKTHKRKNVERLWQIVRYEEKIELIKDLQELKDKEYSKKVSNR